MRGCASCGSHFCDGVQCYLEDEPETEGDPEMEAWLKTVAREEAEAASLINEKLEPKDLAA